MPDVGRLIYLFQTIRQLSLYILTLSYDFDTLPPSFKTNDMRTISVVTPGCKLRPDSYRISFVDYGSVHDLYTTLGGSGHHRLAMMVTLAKTSR